MKRLIKLGLLLTSSLIITGCSRSQSETKDITIVGSTAMQPMIEMAAEEYQQTQTKTQLTVQGGGSGTGLSQVQSGAVTIGNSDIFAKQQPGIKADKLIDHQVAVVGIAPVINKEAGIKNLTLKQLQGVFTGKYKNWKQVGGKDVPIIVINRAQGSGTRFSFEADVLDGKDAINAQEQESSGTVQKMVQATPGSISYLSFSYLNKDTVPVMIDGVKPTPKNVVDNKWKIWAYQHMYTKKNSDQATKDFIKYMNSEKIQKHLIEKLGYISIEKMQVQKDADGNVEMIKR